MGDSPTHPEDALLDSDMELDKDHAEHVPTKAGTTPSDPEILGFVKSMAASRAQLAAATFMF